ncbi:MAG: Branched-chain amino acid ABC transporter, amino acid-binding protein [uncultured Acidimicrobiales bacterium]|uniref:Branched-chain amino acid ABC transporter, amino acid-binding protein n=1 Tax=uncultured Acidimicrobiales bacterium TaxID=310071 RepID=A0A6J4IRC2_9ACTN|nr:MAG: Branched-chain amino acid ABC transporter, amino acid-binding protein [uncultured Acidimicrobiales bacterium]
MHNGQRFWRASALLVTASLAFAACGSDANEEGVGATGEGGAATKTVKIGVIAPLSGELSALGQGIRNGVDLAIKQANDSGKVKGWRIELAAEDDTAKADVGAQVATKLSSDSQVAAVVGTLNSSVAEQVAPILNRASVVMVSPANTNVALTGRDKLPNQQRVYNTYFRVATTDDVQGPFAANYASNELKAKTAVIIHDKKTYGQGLSEAFKGQFEKNGGRVLGTETINPGDKDFTAVLTRIKPLNAEMIYYGGEYPEASLLASQAKQQGINVPIMGGDGMYSGAFFETAKEAGVGTLVTSVGAPTESLSSARDFVDAYKKANYSQPYEAYGAYAYDAAKVIIEALSKTLTETSELNTATRQKLVEETGKVNIDGATGKVSFDRFGDTQTKVLTMYKAETKAGKQEWVAAKTDEFK